MKSFSTWFVILAMCCILGPYALGARPRTVREWRYLAMTIAFLAWLLLFMAELLARLRAATL